MNNINKKNTQQLIPKKLKITIQTPSDKDDMIDYMEKGYVSKIKSYKALWK